MDEQRVKGIRERLEAATPGPWFRDYNVICTGEDDPTDWSDEPMRVRVATCAGEMRDPQAIADADLIAHAPTDLADLLAEVERLEKCCHDWASHCASIYAERDRLPSVVAVVEPIVARLIQGQSPLYAEIAAADAAVRAYRTATTGEAGQ